MSKDAGFSVLELIVSLALLALLLAAVPGTVRMAHRAAATATVIGEASGLDVAMHHLEQAITAAQPVNIRDGEGRARLAFEGDGASLLFVADRSQTSSGTVPHAYRLSLTAQDQGQSRSLMAAITPLDGRGVMIERESSRHVLATNVTGFAIRYFGPPLIPSDGPPTWQSDWRQRNRLPALIELTITTSARPGGLTAALTISPRLRRVR